MNIYLTGLYGVGKQYIGFQYGTKFAEQTVSFLYMNSFGGLEHQDRFFVFALYRFCKHRMLHVHERRAGIFI